MSSNKTRRVARASQQSCTGFLDSSIDLAGETLFVKERQLPSNPCPQCAERLDACTGISSDREGTIPTTGAITVCAYCGTLLEFAESGYVHAPPERLDAIPNHLKSAIEQTIGIRVVAR